MKKETKPRGKKIKSELIVTRQVEIKIVYTTYSDGSIGRCCSLSETLTKVEAAGILSLAINDINKQSYPL